MENPPLDYDAMEVIMRDLGNPRLPAPRSSDLNLFCSPASQTTFFGFEPYVQPEGGDRFRCVDARTTVNCNTRSNNVYRLCACLVEADLIGDPHIDTLKGEHYLLLKQGTFSLWHLSGSLFGMLGNLCDLMWTCRWAVLGIFVLSPRLGC